MSLFSKENLYMQKEKLYSECMVYLKKLCVEIPERYLGSEGNRTASHFFRDEITSFRWNTEMPEFDVMDWKDGGAILKSDRTDFKVFVSPYALGCTVKAQLISVSSVKELEQKEITGKVLLLHGDIAREQLMPKNFVFYNPEAHQKIISLLEKKQPCAIITATGRNTALAGGVYPFPMFEDGDFNIPSVYMTEEEGKRLGDYEGTTVIIKSSSKRIPAKGYNVIGKKGNKFSERIVITAHMDTKKGSPGAIDNATGIVVLLLLAKSLKEYKGERIIEIVALNGEDYFAASGQMNYLNQNRDHFDEILLNINIDGAGYKEGKTAFSLFNLPGALKKKAKEVMNKFTGIIEGPQWPQGDHSIFIQHGRPAIAITSKWFLDNIDQDITHTPKDNMSIVDCKKVVEITEALKYFVD
jgi:aminopeptidase YwaD